MRRTSDSPVSTRVVVPSLKGALRALGYGVIGLNVLCIMEPLIGVLWQRCLATASGVVLEPHHAVLLGVGLWLAYAADRGLDARGGGPQPTLRHAFFARHLRVLGALGLVLGASALLLGLRFLTGGEWLAAASVVGLAMAYLLTVHRFAARKVLKKALAAGVYALGVGCFVWPSTSAPLSFFVGLVGFTLLAGCNLAVISALEVSAPVTQLRATRVGCFALALAALCAVGFSAGSLRHLGLGMALSAGALAALTLPSQRHRELSHALADLALLLPLLPLT